MWASAWLFIGVIALLLSGATLFTDLSDILGGLLAGLTWVLWAFGATNIEIYDTGASGSVQTGGEAIALLGAAFAVVMLLVMLAGSARALDVRDTELAERQ